MAKYPQKPEEILHEFTEKMQRVFGQDLQSIILYGSGARGDYRPGKSDINFLIVLSDAGMDAFSKAMDPLRGWRKRMVATPLFMTKAFICASIDSYPVEFLNMQKSYVVVYGEDVLKELSFDPAELRLQCERELCGKLLLLRTSFLETESRADRIRDLIRASLTAFLSVFQALLHLQGSTLHGSRREIIVAMAETYRLDSDVFLKCLDVKEKKESLSSEDLKTLFENYVREIKRLSEIVDRMEICR
jgi:predicted nucleotidyltransferase